MVYYVYLKNVQLNFLSAFIVLESELTCVHHILIIHFDNLIIFAHYYVVNLIGNLKSVLTFYAGVYYCRCNGSVDKILHQFFPQVDQFICQKIDQIPVTFRWMYWIDQLEEMNSCNILSTLPLHRQYKVDVQQVMYWH
jgi:hypothetical protein